MATETKWKAPLEIRVALVMGLVGFMNAIAAACFTWYVNSHGSPRFGATWSKWFVWIWPAGIMMMPGDSGESIIVLGISLIMNMILYALIGFALGLIWKKLPSMG